MSLSDRMGYVGYDGWCLWCGCELSSGFFSCQFRCAYNCLVWILSLLGWACFPFMYFAPIVGPTCYLFFDFPWWTTEESFFCHVWLGLTSYSVHVFPLPPWIIYGSDSIYFLPSTFFVHYARSCILLSCNVGGGVVGNCIASSPSAINIYPPLLLHLKPPSSLSCKLDKLM